METTKHKLPENISNFFKKLSKYLNTKILFYGSIQRDDYYPGKSDIDIDIFSENTESTITKLVQFLNIKKSKVKNVVWRLFKGQMVYGYKVGYVNDEMKFQAEFSIYDEKYKAGVLEEHLKKISLPFYASFLLNIIKKLYYDCPILNIEVYKYLKKIIFGYCIGLPEDKFVVLSPK